MAGLLSFPLDLHYQTRINAGYACSCIRRYAAAHIGSNPLASAMQTAADTCALAMSVSTCTAAAPPVTLSEPTLARLQQLVTVMASPAANSSSGGPAAPVNHKPAAVVPSVYEQVDQAKRALGETSLGLRIAGVFIVLVAGVIGCCVPFVFKVGTTCMHYTYTDIHTHTHAHAWPSLSTYMHRRWAD